MLFFTALLFVQLHSQNWQSIGGNNQRNGISPVSGPALDSVLWTISNAAYTNLGNAVYTYGDKFVTSRSVFSPVYEVKLECRNLLSGSLLWTKQLGAGSRLFAMGFLGYVYTHDYFTDTLYALHPEDGSVIWARKETQIYGGSNGMLFACEGDPVIRGKRIDRETGITVWSNNYIVPVMPDAGHCLYGNTYYHYTGSIVTPKQLIAIDLATGLTKYLSAALPGDGDQEIPLSVGPDGRIYIWRDGGLLYSFTDDGTGFFENWTYTPDAGTGTYGNIGFDADGNLYLSDGQYLKRLSKADGSVVNTTSFPLTAGSSFNARIAVGNDGTVYVSNCDASGKYWAFTPDLQTTLWQKDVPYNTYCGPNLSHDGIMVITGSGTGITALKTQQSLPPVADFLPHNITIYEGQTVSFVDFSSYGADSVMWWFQGGSPATSGIPNPVVTYYNAGIYQVRLVVKNASGQDTLALDCCVEVLLPSGISEAGNGADIYPNPCTGFLHIRLQDEGISRLCIYSTTGIKIHETASFDAPGDIMKIDMTSHAPGIYVAELSGRGWRKTCKIVKM